MTQQHDMEQHLHHLLEMRNILNAMKNLAFMESRKLSRLLHSQQQMVDNLEQVAVDFLSFHPYPESINQATHTLYLLIGSERGFCGNFNEKLLQMFADQYPLSENDRDTMLVVGNKLGHYLEADSRVASFISGADFEEEIDSVLNRIVSAVKQLQDKYQTISLTAVYHGEQTDQLISEPLLPPFQMEFEQQPVHSAPVLNLSPQAFFTDLSEQYLFAALHEISYASMMIENHWRALHLDGAVNRLDKNMELLKKKSRMLRQEAITEEIEVIMLGAESMLQGSGNWSWNRET